MISKLEKFQPNMSKLLQPSKTIDETYNLARYKITTKAIEMTKSRSPNTNTPIKLLE